MHWTSGKSGPVKGSALLSKNPDPTGNASNAIAVATAVATKVGLLTKKF